MIIDTVYLLVFNPMKLAPHQILTCFWLIKFNPHFSPPTSLKHEMATFHYIWLQIAGIRWLKYLIGNNLCLTPHKSFMICKTKSNCNQIINTINAKRSMLDFAINILSMSTLRPNTELARVLLLILRNSYPFPFEA